MSFEASFYENPALWASLDRSEADRKRIAVLADKLPPDIKTLLDVGCGNGMFLKYLAERTGRGFQRLCGVDRSTAALVCVQTEKVRASIDSLPFAAAEFDAVSCLETLEHLPQAIFAGALKEISRIAGRYILISVPYAENLRLALSECTECHCRFNSSYHLHSFSEYTMQHLFDNKGFVCREVFHLHPQKIVPDAFEIMLRFLRMVKKAMLRQTQVIMPEYAVCPACGFSPSTDGKRSSNVPLPPMRKPGLLRVLLTYKRSWRWIGALYERQTLAPPTGPGLPMVGKA